ncbi:MAG TPA: hypothetical protein VGP46_08270, partial [Acidimicrobiales bacterium]|nr:hypothetical protein [Acidimicrobiales bacterium]
TTTTEPPSPWRGDQGPCQVLVPPFSSKQTKTFYTCPPKRVMIVGDSVAFTMGIEMGIDEENWGTMLDNVSILGCGFLVGYPVWNQARWGDGNKQCESALSTWVADVKSFKPQAVIVEMGWWDSMIHLVNGHSEELGESSYDTLLLDHMLAFIKALDVGTRPLVYFLTVPWMDPAKFPNGQSQPAAAPAFHNEINALLAQAVKETSGTALVDVSPWITPAGKFQLDVDGAQCRTTDGIHIYYGAPGPWISTPCGRALQEGVLSIVRQALA